MEEKNSFVSLADLRVFMEEWTNAASAGKEPKQEELMTSKEVQKLFDITPVTLWKWSKRGYLNAIKIGGKKLYYKRADVEKLQRERA